jgi:MFS family permease
MYGSPTSEDLQYELGFTKVQWDVFNSLGLFLAAVGALIAIPMVRILGRRLLLFATAILTVVCWVLLGPAKAKWLAFLSRVLQGIVIGLNATVCPMYLVEAVPTEYRGTFGTFHQLLCNLGILYGNAISIGANWRLLAWLMLIPPGLLCCLCFVVPDSKVVERDAKPEPICGPGRLTPCLHMLALVLSQQFSGVNAIMTNLNAIFIAAGSPLKSSVASTIAQIAGIPSCLLASWLVERFGRRPTWIAGCSLATFGHLLLWASNVWSWPSWLPIVALFLYLFAFGISLGPIVWILIPELFSDAIRSFWLAIAVVINWLLAGGITLAWPSVQDAIGVGWGFFIFALICVLTVLYGIFLMPETRGSEMGDVGGPARVGDESVPDAEPDNGPAQEADADPGAQPEVDSGAGAE